MFVPLKDVVIRDFQTQRFQSVNVEIIARTAYVGLQRSPGNDLLSVLLDEGLRVVWPMPN